MNCVMSYIMILYIYICDHTEIINMGIKGLTHLLQSVIWMTWTLMKKMLANL